MTDTLSTKARGSVQGFAFFYPTLSSLFRYEAHDPARDMPRGKETPVIVKDVMARNIVTVGPETSTLDAIDTMRRKKVACLPVVKDGRLIGIVSERDFLRVAGELLTSQLRKG